TLVAIRCGWALCYGWVLWSLDCSGCCILGFYRLGGWNMTRKKLGGCQMYDCHGSRESFKGRAMLPHTLRFSLDFLDVRLSSDSRFEHLFGASYDAFFDQDCPRCLLQWR
ncbi:hypothetical protein CPB85DRAFT_1313934, partial [Mucidula mucida]